MGSWVPLAMCCEVFETPTIQRPGRSQAERRGFDSPRPLVFWKLRLVMGTLGENTTGHIGLTDYKWFSFLRARPHFEEINFWKPSAQVGFGVAGFGTAIATWRFRHAGA